MARLRLWSRPNTNLTVPGNGRTAYGRSCWAGRNGRQLYKGFNTQKRNSLLWCLLHLTSSFADTCALHIPLHWVLEPHPTGANASEHQSQWQSHILVVSAQTLVQHNSWTGRNYGQNHLPFSNEIRRKNAHACFGHRKRTIVPDQSGVWRWGDDYERPRFNGRLPANLGAGRLCGRCWVSGASVDVRQPIVLGAGKNVIILFVVEHFELLDSSTESKLSARVVAAQRKRSGYCRKGSFHSVAGRSPSRRLLGMLSTAAQRWSALSVGR